MLSTSHNFLFIHVPKTGGNSIQDVLRKYTDDKIVTPQPWQDGIERFEVASDRYRTHKHSTLADYRSEYGEELFDRLFKLCVVRNPWDRCASHFFSPHRGEVTYSEGEFAHFIKHCVSPLQHYLSIAGESLASAVTQISMVLRFETLSADFETACQAIGIPSASLSVRNASNKGDYRKHYTKQLADLVAEQFHEEIELFGYCF